MFDVRHALRTILLRRAAMLMVFVVGVVFGGILLSQVQTSAQEVAEPPCSSADLGSRPGSRADRLLRAEERQASALEGIHAELRSLRTDLRRAR
jgi:hypothetical protein